MNSLLNKLSIRNGLILAGISAVITIILYIINPLMQYTNFVVPILTIVIIIALFVILGIDIRRNLGGYWSFGQAFISLLIMSVIVLVVGILINFVIFKFVDPTMPTKVNDALLNVTTQRLEKMGMEQDKIDEATKPFTDGETIAKMQPTLVNELKAFGWALLFYAVLDLIIAACIKKNPPMFAPVSDQEIIE